MLKSAPMNRPTSLRGAAESPTFSPLYRQIKDLMMRSLEAGEWRPGDAIPSETELASRFQVSQGTVRKAIDEMAAENLLVRRQGKGTFVATHDDPRAFFRFLRLMPDQGVIGHSDSVPLDCWRGPAGAEVATALGVAPDDVVVCVKRLLKFDDRPVVYDEIFLLADLFGDLTLEVLTGSQQSLYSLYESRYGVRMIRAEERLRAVAASGEAVGLLGVAEGSPLLLVERTAFTYANKPVEWRRGFYLTTDFHYLNGLA